MEDSLKKKFQTLLDYQKKDIELRKLNNIIERDQALMAMEKFKRVFNEAKQTLADCEQQSGELISMYEELQRYVDENEAVLAALESAEASSEEDLEARVKKLDSLKSKFQSADKKMHVVDEKSRAVCKSRVDAVKSGNAAKQQFADAKGKHNELVNSKRTELDKLKAELAALRTSLDEKLYEEYEKLVHENKFPPIVPATNDERKGMFNCGGCGLGLPQQGNAFLKDRGWCRCDNCRRIIVKLN